MTSELLAASFVCKENRALRRHLTRGDWLRFLLKLVRHPYTWARTLRARSRHPDWWAFLELHTEARFNEARTSARIP